MDVYAAAVERIRALVSAVQNGNVSAASADTGIPQQTLSRVVAAGNAKGPGVGVLTHISKFYRVPIPWLLLGQGDGPPTWPPAANPAMRALLRWLYRVDRLDLDTSPHRRICVLPLVSSRALREMGGADGFFTNRKIGEPFYTSLEMEIESWLQLLTGMATRFEHGEDHLLAAQLVAAADAKRARPALGRFSYFTDVSYRDRHFGSARRSVRGRQRDR